MMKKLSLVLMVVVMFFAVNVLAEAPCVNPKVTPDEIKTWDKVGVVYGQNRTRITTVVNPNPTAEIKSSIYVEMNTMNGIILFRYCYLDKDGFHDFFYCRKCKCWHEMDTSNWPEGAVEGMIKRLMDALNSNHS